jgi:2-amino-4-hydroxy-6-hydroxymethyldihydropteridine diphosphokinase
MKKVFLGLGSNLGRRDETLHAAKKLIGESIGAVIRASSVYETEPWGFESDKEFLNMVLVVETDLPPSGILGRILMIESQLGRTRYRCGFHYLSRSIDIDILFYDNEILDQESLKIPHPRLHERRFVMVPLAEIAPDQIHPVFKKTILELLRECEDDGKVREYRGGLYRNPLSAKL